MTETSTNTPIDEVLTAQEAAAYLRVKLQTIYDWVNDEKIPVERAGRLLRFRKAALDAWLKRDQQPTEAPTV